MTYFNAGYMAGALGLSLCHYVLALSPYLWGISVITPLPLGEGKGEGPAVDGVVASCGRCCVRLWSAVCPSFSLRFLFPY